MAFKCTWNPLSAKWLPLGYSEDEIVAIDLEEDDVLFYMSDCKILRVKKTSNSYNWQNCRGLGGIMSNDFDFIEHYDVPVDVTHEEQLSENTAISALNCAFIGFGGGGGKLAKAFLDL